MTSIVMDASVIASWFFYDEAHGIHARLLDHIDKLKIHVPSIFEHEFMNILLMAEKRGRLNHETQKNILAIVSHYPLSIEPSTVMLIVKINVLEMARTYHLTAYDAAYLELAISLGKVPLITYDKSLLQTAKKLKLKTNL